MLNWPRRPRDVDEWQDSENDCNTELHSESILPFQTKCRSKNKTPAPKCGRSVSECFLSYFLWIRIFPFIVWKVNSGPPPLIVPVTVLSTEMRYLPSRPRESSTTGLLVSGSSFTSKSL